jgi:hypothetical protein
MAAGAVPAGAELGENHEARIKLLRAYGTTFV